VVFIHGWPLHSATFRDSASLLSTRFRCHLFDLPGAGDTQIGATSPLDLRSHIASAKAVVGALGLTRYALVAHDSGGFVARHLAADDSRVVGLVLGNTEIPGWHPPLMSRVKRMTNLPFGPSLLRMLMNSRRFRRSSSGFRGCFRDIDHIEGEFHELFVAPLLASRARGDAAQAIVRTLDERWIEQLVEVHARVHAPVQLLWGEHDRIFPLALARAMLPQFPRATLEVLPGGKTFAHEEQPATFATLAGSFLESVFFESERASA
jgi:pimeloyl-ACP methyl ester carboxylesterase